MAPADCFTVCGIILKEGLKSEKDFRLFLNVNIRVSGSIIVWIGSVYFEIFKTVYADNDNIVSGGINENDSSI